MPRAFRFTVSMPKLTEPIARWRDEVRRVEDLGFSSVCISDHLTGGWAMDPIVAMTVAAEATTTLRVLAMVFCNDYRHPVLLHKSMANLDVFSGGRVEIGLGAGWRRADHDAAGLPFEPAGVRVERLAEAAVLLRALFGESPVAHRGEHYRVELDGLPKPVQRPHPPILIGGGGRRVLATAGRHADIVAINPRLAPGVDPLASAAALSPTRVAEQVGWVRDAAAKAGRDPDGLELSTRMLDVRVRLRGIEHRSVSSLARRASPAALAGSPVVLHGDLEQCVDTLVERRERYGISYIHLGDSLNAAAPVVARLAGT